MNIPQTMNLSSITKSLSTQNTAFPTLEILKFQLHSDKILLGQSLNLLSYTRVPLYLTTLLLANSGLT